MTRREEIEKAAKLKRHDIASEVDSKSCAAYDGFVMGAEWADKTMIEKFAKWLSKYRYGYWDDAKILVRNFIKEMEE